MPLVFVFGTLKRGFPLHPSLSGARFRGLARTRLAFPMFVAGSILGPMMLDRPGRGLRVVGEIYEVTPGELRAADKAEKVGAPGNFRRSIEVGTAGGDVLSVLAYFKDPRLARPRHSGYLRIYRDTRFRPPGRRPPSLPPLRLLSHRGGS